DGAFTVLRVLHALARTKAALSGWLLDLDFRRVEFLAARGEELGDIFDRIVGGGGITLLRRLRFASILQPLVLVLVVVMALFSVVGSRRSCPSGTSGAAWRADILNQLRRHFLQEPRWDTRLGHVRTVTAAITRPTQDKRVHGTRHADIGQASLFLDIVG